MPLNRSEWTLLRTKTDETVDDTDFAGSNTAPAAADVDPVQFLRGSGVAVGKIYICILAVDASRAVQNRGAATVDVQVVTTFRRDQPRLGGASGLSDAVIDSVTQTVPLNRRIDIDLAGADMFTIRIFNDVTLPAATDLEVWWREAT